MATNWEARGAAITDGQVETILDLLSRGRTLNAACKAAGVHVRAFRWRRHADRFLADSVNSVRVRALLGRAARLRAVAEKLEAQAAKLAIE